jgi:Domain of unknown function (DUF1883)
MFDFLHRDLGHLSQGSVIEVVIDKQANVVLLDDSNFRAYQSGGRFDGYGGWYERSPIRIAVPHAGRWNVAIDLGNTEGQIRAAVNVLSPA